MPLRGEKLDKPSYANLRSTGGGAVGEAWVGDHEVLGCKVVQKRYSVIGMEDSAACREPRILLQMEHPNVVRVLEAQWDPEMDRAIIFVRGRAAAVRDRPQEAPWEAPQPSSRPT